MLKQKLKILGALCCLFPPVAFSVTFGNEETPEHANEVLGTTTYEGKALSVYADDYPFAGKIVVNRVKPLLEKRGKKVTEQEIQSVTITYLSAIPGGSNNPKDICISYETLVPGFRHATPLYLCLSPIENSMQNFIENRHAIKEWAIKAILAHRNLPVNEQNTQALLKEKVHYFGSEPPPPSLSTECVQFTVPAHKEVAERTFYLCVN